MIVPAKRKGGGEDRAREPGGEAKTLTPPEAEWYPVAMHL
jgi:hypothetical protein